ncbi:MAG TPA: formate dehydrogenase accessory sulfurtransferase FdhD [Phenylobacterium sp.]|jgi:FdhD protein|uniref:formate dehydrogenase accessory sulfurtransferase FdhD n=1 Tax=Phenylobacterium sp. TaxID=1871053 RepID=UPI002C366F5A|nr:formate dehydrogenase accessory sulfurtransferase FdhD [Phenylobacterium sp.]HXA37952.1 formate dehydrogenase accessory sulfurtransferase FdhD [Phenylobacterium sp.]
MTPRLTHPASSLPVSRRAPVMRMGRDGGAPDHREVPEETPVALVHDGSTTAVMMATPSDLEDFALGFSLTEGIVADAREIESLEVVETELGVEVRMWLSRPRSETLAGRRRYLAGPTGCGLCGIDSLGEAMRASPKAAEGLRISPAEIAAALEALPERQTLGAATRAVHAAGWWALSGDFACLREDVGRHNALDKLVGALAAAKTPRPDGALFLTSRISVEMVQKAAVLGAQVLVAVSAPTALAIRTAEQAAITLVGVARRDGFEVFTRPDRIS